MLWHSTYTTRSEGPARGHSTASSADPWQVLPSCTGQGEVVGSTKEVEVDEAMKVKEEVEEVLRVEEKEEEVVEEEEEEAGEEVEVEEEEEE